MKLVDINPYDKGYKLARLETLIAKIDKQIPFITQNGTETIITKQNSYLVKLRDDYINNRPEQLPRHKNDSILFSTATGTISIHDLKKTKEFGHVSNEKIYEQRVVDAITKWLELDEQNLIIRTNTKDIILNNVISIKRVEKTFKTDIQINYDKNKILNISHKHGEKITLEDGDDMKILAQQFCGVTDVIDYPLFRSFVTYVANLLGDTNFESVTEISPPINLDKNAFGVRLDKIEDKDMIHDAIFKDSKTSSLSADILIIGDIQINDNVLTAVRIFSDDDYTLQGINPIMLIRPSSKDSVSVPRAQKRITHGRFMIIDETRMEHSKMLQYIDRDIL